MSKRILFDSPQGSAGDNGQPTLTRAGLIKASRFEGEPRLERETMSWSLRIGKVFGIPIYIHFSWLLILVIIIFTFSQSGVILPKGESILVRVSGGLATALLLFASVIAHEVSHGLLAIRYGIPVKRITLFVLGGVAQTAKEATRPWAEIAVALAGPMCSFLIAMFFCGIWFATRDSFSDPFAGNPVFALVVINLLLAILNLLPGFPLDGGRVVRALFWWITKNYRLATQIASTIGQGIAFTVMLAGIAVMLLSAEYQGFDPFSGLYLAFFGWFLQNAASVSYQQTVIRHNLEDLTVNQVMAIETPRCVVSASLNLQQLAQEHIMPTRYSYLPVAEGGKLAGVITLRGVNSVPRQLWAFTSVTGVMHQPRQFLTISADQSALSALEQMEEYDIDQLVIVDEDTIVGVITKDALIHLGQNDPKQEKEETM